MENTVQNEAMSEKQEETSPQATPPPAKEGDANDANEPFRKLQDDLTEARDKYLRLYAEFDNYRRRSNKEKIDLIQSANEDLIKNLLPVMDDFARAEKSFKERTDKGAEGFFLIQNKFRKTLESAGVAIMEIKPGADFDPDLHDAITQVPAADESLKGKVVEVIDNGYLLKDKVIRHAKVIVGH